MQLVKKNPFGFNIRTDKYGRVSLTDLWKYANSPNKKDPSTWQSREATSEFIDACKTLITPKTGELELIASKTGRYGGTFAHKQIALAYAKYLSPELHIAVNQIFFERVEEEKNPDKIAERYIDTYKRKGKDEKWIEARFKGINTRNIFTHTLKDHGVTGPEGYRRCTNAIYKPLYGGGTKLIRAKKSLSGSAKIRDNMSDIELKAVEFAESLATSIIEKENISGNKSCEKACLVSSQRVAQSIINARNDIKKNLSQR